MPIFEYRCDDCGTQFEKLMRASGGDLVECPSCGQQHVRRQLSVFAALSGAKPAERLAGGCPAGMCPAPDLCGRN